MQRATSTSVDPNVLGSLLNLSLGIAIPQFLRSARSSSAVAAGLIAVIGICLGLTVSRDLG
jgi:hypothetical protein